MRKIFIFGFVIFIILVLTGAGWFYFSAGSKLKNGTTDKIASQNQKSEKQVAGNSVCENQYQELLKLYGQNYDDCKVNVKKASGCDKDPKNQTPQKQANVVVIFDSSGSMAAKLPEGTKIDIAKEATINFIKNLDTNTNLSVVVYGHKGSNQPKDKKVSCAGIDEVYWLSKVKPEIAISKISGLNPVGFTPIADSLEKAKNILSKYPKESNNNMIILVSDGTETCDGDPVAKAKELLASGYGVVTNVIGFDVSGSDEEKLKAVASSGGGKYFSVKNKNDFTEAFKENKNFMAGFDCYMEQDDVWLGNKLDVNFKKNECMNRLEMDEKHELELNAKLKENGVTAECQNYILQQYQKRYEQIKAQIEAGYAEGKNESEQEKSKLENVKNEMDEGEDVFE
jgi:Ca-activated chloride channel homolog